MRDERSYLTPPMVPRTVTENGNRHLAARRYWDGAALVIVVSIIGCSTPRRDCEDAGNDYQCVLSEEAEATCNSYLDAIERASCLSARTTCACVAPGKSFPGGSGGGGGSSGGGGGGGGTTGNGGASACDDMSGCMDVTARMCTEFGCCEGGELLAKYENRCGRDIDCIICAAIDGSPEDCGMATYRSGASGGGEYEGLFWCGLGTDVGVTWQCFPTDVSTSGCFTLGR